MAKQRKKKPAPKRRGLHALDNAFVMGAVTFAVFGLLIAANQSPQAPEQEFVVSAEHITQEDEEALQRMIHSIEMERYEPVVVPQAPEKPLKPAIQPKGSKVAHMVRKAAEANGVDPELFHGLVLTESGGNPNVGRSKAGAIGLAQLMPATAKELGVDARIPEQNVRGGASYLSRLTERYNGNETLGLLAYNWGAGNVDKWLKRGGKWSQLPKESRDYISRVKVNAAVSSQSEQYALRD